MTHRANISNTSEFCVNEESPIRQLLKIGPEVVFCANCNSLVLLERVDELTAPNLAVCEMCSCHIPGTVKPILSVPASRLLKTHSSRAAVQIIKPLDVTLGVGSSTREEFYHKLKLNHALHRKKRPFNPRSLLKSNQPT